MTQETYNPETLTEQDRALLDATRELTPEEIDFMIDLAQAMEAAPQKSEARAAAVGDLLKRYRMQTAAGRESFLEALQAV